MIPVFAVTTINQLHHFDQLVKSIDYPIKTFSVLCNTYSLDYVIEIQKLCKSDYVQNFMLSWSSYNMGCSTSWNYHIKMNSDSPYWLFAGDDTRFAPDDLRRANEAMQTCDFLGAEESICLGVIFGLNQHCINTVGFFDENIHPSNFEDNEYIRRVRHHNNVIEKRISIKSYHDPSGTYNRGYNDEQKALFNKYYRMNEKYYNQLVASNKFEEPKFNFEERSKKLLVVK